jgi:Pyruvate/2-oxoacid:ferredoxin oxidoreductase delta subunit
VEGSEFVIECDGIVTAIGEGTDLSLLPDRAKDGWKVATDRCLATPIEKVFAAGDAVDGKGTVTAAVGSGRRVASMVDAYLRGEGLPEEAPASYELWTREVNREEIVRYASLNPAYLQPQPRPEIAHLPAKERVSSFAEVVQGWTLEQAVAEARRCITCGTCNECGNCYYLCPGMAVQKRMDDYGYEIDFDHCKGCGICVEECPRGALTLREVAR